MVSALIRLLPVAACVAQEDDAANLMQLKKSKSSAPDYGTTQGYGYGTTTMAGTPAPTTTTAAPTTTMYTTAAPTTTTMTTTTATTTTPTTTTTTQQGCFEAYLPDHNCHSYEEHGYHCKGDWCAADAAEVSGDISICAKKAEEGTKPVEHYEGFRCGHCHCVPGNDGGHGDTCTFGQHDKPWCYVNADCPGATEGSFGVWSEEPCSGYTTTTTTTTMAPTTTTTTARPTTTTVAPCSDFKYERHQGKNCYNGYGAERIDESYEPNIGVGVCKARCTADSQCEGFVYHPGKGWCQLRKAVVLGSCDTRKGDWDMYMKDGCAAPISICAGEAAYGTICPDGSEIETLEDCRVAVEQMHPGVEVSEWVGDYDQIPRFCSFRESDGYLHFNPGAAGKARKDLAPLCKPVLGTYGDVCPEGGEIKTLEECRVAVGQLHFGGEISEWVGDYDKIPQCCSFRESDGYLHFNPGAAGKGRSDLAPLCKIISAAPAPVPAPPPAPLTDPSGCPVCTCNSPSWWHPFNGCSIHCGAKCGGQCCCIPGVGACPR